MNDVSPYRALWAAVMHRGMQDAADEFRRAMKNGDTPDLRIGALGWMHSDRKHVGSWVWLCSIFDLDPEIARDKARSNFRKLYTRGEV